MQISHTYMLPNMFDVARVRHWQCVCGLWKCLVLGHCFTNVLVPMMAAAHHRSVHFDV